MSYSKKLKVKKKTANFTMDDLEQDLGEATKMSKPAMIVLSFVLLETLVMGTVHNIGYVIDGVKWLF